MSDTIDYIDDYFTGALSEGERREFEARCSSDEVFASEVAFYISARQVTRSVLLEQKQNHWKEDIETGSVVQMKTGKKAGFKKWVTYVAAACLVFLIAGYFLFYQPTPQRLADKYINNETLSQTMDANHDSLQTGIASMQAGDYAKALAIFEDLQSRDAKNDEAKKYAGLSYLRLHNYDKALEQFRNLSAMTGLQSNSGDILQATTLIKRNAPGDKNTAKALLEKVVKEDEEGSKEAKEMLDNW